MKQLILLAVAALGGSLAMSAAPVCVGGSLASYIALGSGGCMIGANLFSQFTENSFLTGATGLLPSSIVVTPIGGATNPGLMFSGNVSASSGQLFDALINYVLSGNSYTSDSLVLAGTSATGTGAVTDIQNFCRNGNFTAPTFVTGCPGGEGPGSPLILIGNGSTKASFTATSLGITHNFTIDSGSGGTAAGISVTDQFATAAPNAVPEPATAFVFLSALGVLATLRRRL